MKLLLADDNKVTRRIVEALLTKSGYEITSVEDGLSAFEALSRSDAPPLAILDVNMPGMDGLEVCRRVRSLPLGIRTYIILLTGDSDRANLVAGLEAGADDYIAKPFERDELLARLKVGARMASLQASLANNIHVLEATSADLKRSSTSLLDANDRLKEEVAERRRAEASMATKTKQLQTVADAMRSFIQTGDWRQTRAHLLRAALVMTGSKIGFVTGFDDHLTARDVAEKGLSLHRSNQDRLSGDDPTVTPAGFMAGLLSEITTSGTSLVLNDLRVRTDGSVALNPKTPRNFLGVPLTGENRIVGGIAVANGPDRYGDAEQLELEILAQTASVLCESYRRMRREADLEEQLKHSQKLESIGQLAAGIAHEINTPMQYFGDNAKFLQEAFGDLQAVHDRFLETLNQCREQGLLPDVVRETDALIEEKQLGYLQEEIPKAINQTLEGVERVTKIVRSMKDFAHPDKSEKEAVDLNRAIENTITVSRSEWKYGAEMVTDLDPNLPPVFCYQGELSQVLLNLIVNASHAIQDVVGDGANGKGTITISTRHQDNWLEIRVQDTGTGIPEEARPRIFDPFFTTKQVGRGTGQGLSIAYRAIVERHRGTLSFDTELGRGTTFIICLPVQPA
jgi:signal transduction histidine kinase/DNA-binding response OmpR family regulator